MQFFQEMLDIFTKNKLGDKDKNLFSNRNSVFIQYDKKYDKEEIEEKKRKNPDWNFNKTSFSSEFSQN
jgi:hypothetical protein